ncbi:hypothetical protein QTP86_008165 [Hemibagrus guttatus]|nr:hypothetical protein QTP86_008165 [Hemibagrus guttatus]
MAPQIAAAGSYANHQLYARAEKCEFHKNSITFLGYLISQQGVELDPKKVTVDMNWPKPTTIKELQQFLGFANYRRFIRNYSSIASPLTSLLRGKPRQCNGPNRQVDASSCGIGAVLSQHHRIPGKVYLCAYFSDKLTPADANYDVGNRELLLIKATLEKWRHWLEGARHPSLVLMDHHNL